MSQWDSPRVFDGASVTGARTLYLDGGQGPAGRSASHHNSNHHQQHLQHQQQQQQQQQLPVLVNVGPPSTSANSSSDSRALEVIEAKMTLLIDAMRDMKTTFTARLDAMDQRLARIEAATSSTA